MKGNVYLGGSEPDEDIEEVAVESVSKTESLGVRCEDVRSCAIYAIRARKPSNLSQLLLKGE